MAAAATVRVPGSASRHRRPHHHLGQPCRFQERRRRCRDPLWPRQLAGPACRLADGRSAVSGLQSCLADRRQTTAAPGGSGGPRAASYQRRDGGRLAAVADCGRPADPDLQASRRHLRPQLHDRAGRDRRHRCCDRPDILCRGRHRQGPPCRSIQDHAARRRGILPCLA